MSAQAIFVSQAFTPGRRIADAVVLIEDSTISAIGSRNEITVPSGMVRHELPGFTLAPGFVDLHIHGAGGHDVMDGASEALAVIAGTVARKGTTALLATTVTASEDRTRDAAAGIAAWMQSKSNLPGKRAQAEILGIHFEGPFINPARSGVHSPKWIIPPSIDLFHRLTDAAQGCARILTLAPELPGALELVRSARSAGYVVSFGHTDATYEEAMAAIDCGVCHAAHVFNAMRPFTHRDSGVIGAVLGSSAVTAELIADGVHVDDGAIRTLLAAKGPRGVALVSDGTAATGMPDGKYRLGTQEVTVSGGISRSAEGKLAGSTLSLDCALRKTVSLGVPLTEALTMLTETPARLLEIEKRKGVLAPGADADLVFLDRELNVAGVMTRGAGWPRD